MDNESVITYLGNKWPSEITHHEPWQNDEGIGLSDKKTPLFQVMNTALGEVDATFDLFETSGFQIRLLGLRCEGLEFLFLNGKKRIRSVRLLRPSVTRLGEKKRRRAINLEVPISITAIGIHIHISQYHQGVAVCGRAFQLQNRLAIIEIVTR